MKALGEIMVKAPSVAAWAIVAKQKATGGGAPMPELDGSY